MNWYQIDTIDALDSPALVIFPERVKQNIQTAIQMVGEVARLRPHVKTNKSREAVQLMLDAGISKFKCATIAEAEMMGMVKAPDVLLAYQPNGPKLQRFIAVIKKYPNTKYACLIDNEAAAAAMAVAFSANGITVPVYLDVNLGMNRTGIAPEQAPALYSAASAMAGIKPVGLHGYDGHLRAPDFELRRQQCNEAYSKLEAASAGIIASGLPAPVIIAGGSPSFSIHCKREKIECSPGTFIYWDKGYTDLCAEQHFLTAALVISRVISIPAPNKLCLDLGHKSIAPENEIGRRVWFLNAPELKAVSQSEEHLVMEAAEGHGFKVGDVLYGLPIHICPTVALYETAITIENGKATGEWRTIARDRSIEC